MKVALYARYSSDSQRDASIADQFRVCRAYAEKQGWQIIEEYSDHAISGASLLRHAEDLSSCCPKRWTGYHAIRKTSPVFISAWNTRE